MATESGRILGGMSEAEDDKHVPIKKHCYGLLYQNQLLNIIQNQIEI